MKKISTLLMMVCCLSAWAIEQDAKGNYLIGSVADWKEFAQVVVANPTANALMTADINLGSDQTTIGSDDHLYKGSFDGLGHTLTIHFDNLDGELGCLAPFLRVGEGFSVKNLHVDGSIMSDGCGVGGVVGVVYGDATVSRCWSSVKMEARDVSSEQGTIGGLVSVVPYMDNNGWVTANLLIEDCIFTGEIVNVMYNGGFMSHTESAEGVTTIRRGLQLGKHADAGSECGTFIRFRYGNVELEESTLFYGHVYEEAQGIQATKETLADGSITAVLQAGREELVWEQDEVDARPALSVFLHSAPTAIDQITEAALNSKVIRDGQVFILRGDKTFTVTGQEVK